VSAAPAPPAAARRDLRALFAPASVAVVGASDDPVKWGNWLARGAIRAEHRRPVHLVNRRGGEVLGRPRAVRQAVGDPELGGDVDRPRGPVAGDHPGESLPGLRLAHVRLPLLGCPHGR